MSNKELYFNICRTAYASVYWSRKNVDVEGWKHTYGPMLEDNVFLSIFESADKVGAYDMEVALGRRLKVKELLAVPLSCYYLLFCLPVIDEDEETTKKLEQFQNIIEQRIRRCESNARRWEGRDEAYPVQLYVTFQVADSEREEAGKLGAPIKEAMISV